TDSDVRLLFVALRPLESVDVVVDIDEESVLNPEPRFAILLALVDTLLDRFAMLLLADDNALTVVEIDVNELFVELNPLESELTPLFVVLRPCDSEPMPLLAVLRPFEVEF
ncbi:hypothetical protein VI03_31085, partial [Burkholderia vietnamiensis]|uniref:hypothetical protein n=1 Tax=Burkholderia vietnamiensis TaxID=60552 RepID=UPI0006225418